MLERWQVGVDTVYAVKKNRTEEPWLKRVGASMFYGILGQGQRLRIPPGRRRFSFDGQAGRGRADSPA
jgi:hypothetical protein